LKHQLYDQQDFVVGVDKSTQIKDYFYNTYSKSKHILGVSSYGTLVQVVSALEMDVILSLPDSNVNTTFVFGRYIDVENNRVLVLLGTLKTLLMMIERKLIGYGKGIFGADITFKIFAELGLDMMTVNVQDIACRGKLTCFGPTTHADEFQFKLLGNMLSSTLTLLALGIKTHSLPEEWAFAVRELLYDTYTVKLSFLTDDDLTCFTMPRLCADDALAIPNGLKTSDLDIKFNKTDWPHLYRAIYDNRHKLIDSSDERVSELMMDITFIHESYDTDLRDMQVDKTTAKWLKRGEHELVQYLVDTKFNRRFSRCDGEPGEQTDTCSLEAFHGKTLKGSDRCIRQRRGARNRDDCRQANPVPHLARHGAYGNCPSGQPEGNYMQPYMHMHLIYMHLHHMHLHDMHMHLNSLHAHATHLQAPPIYVCIG
jgi:hypothetical protein